MFWIVFKNDASGNIISHTINFQRPTVNELLDGELANATLPPSAVSEMNLSDKTIMEIVEFFKDTNMFLKSAPLYSSISNIYSPIIAKHVIYERAKENAIEQNMEGDFQFFLLDHVHLKTITNYSEMISRILESEPVIRSAIIVSIIN
jgi:hypothetical protein